MNPLATALIAGTLVVAGKWADGNTPNLDNAIGVAGIAVGLAIIDQGNEKLANAFSWLILLSIIVVYFPKIARGTGLTQ